MFDLKKLQKELLAAKRKRGFNTTDVPLEFCLLNQEVSEAFNAYIKNLPDIGEELADVAIFLFALAEILHVDLEKELLRKIAKNKKREYKIVNRVGIRTKGE